MTSRRPIALLTCALFLAASLAGCGGTPSANPPAEAKAGPPPGTVPDMLKQKDQKKK